MMAKLILSRDMHVLEEFPLEKECMTIGRKPDNDIQVNDRAISGYHCQIITVLNDSFLEDLQSTNGTFVNTRRITKYALRDGDLINLGTHQLQYANEFAGAESGNTEYDKTMILQTDPPKQNLIEQVQKPSLGITPPISPLTAQVQKTHASLEILNGSNKGKRYEVTRAMTTLGKPGSQVAVITRRGRNFVIIGVEADTAGQYPSLNGEPVSVRSMSLSDEDQIEIGGIRMIFHLT
ncbi:FHA domain-containing protein [Acidihalobacter yilgarnensis]|nr:FHA domain-containing protein [Acidihalobacter yilgarnensis]